MGEFRFKQFSVRNERSPLKLGTDAVVLGASMTIRPEDKTLLDIGTGTGVIALMAAQRHQNAHTAEYEGGMASELRIDAIEIDPDAAAEARTNFASSPWPCLLCSINVPLAGFKPAKCYDHIFSNPPFFENSLRNPDTREAVARHADSMSYRDILHFSSEFLSGSGHLSLILPSSVEIPLMRTAASFGLFPFRNVRIRTTARKAVSRLVVEFSRGKTSGLEEEELVLQEGAERTAGYAALTRDFYL